MLSRFSVRKPYVIVVAVIVALILGGVSLTKMKTDLYPEMDLPYLGVITTDAGASAEEVESEVTDVLEGALSTVSGVSNVTSTSADNYSAIFLEFEDGTDMDSALVKVSSAVNEVASQLPDGAGNPNYMEIGTDMMATLYLGATDDEKDIYELTEFVQDKVVPELERIDGVADVSVAGAVEQSVEVRLDQDKIDAVNDKLAAQVDEGLASAKQQLDDAQTAIDQAQSELDAQKAQLDEATGGRENAPDSYAQIDAAQAQIDEQSAQLATSREEFETQRDAALAQANIDSLVSKSTLAQVITAQNFAMPAGYIDDADDGQWLVRVGEGFTSVEELSNLVLADIDGVGQVKLSDVATVTLIDNAGDSYMRINDGKGVLLSVFKNSTASTSEVSKAVASRITELEADYSSLSLDVLFDQGSYIELYIGNILQSLLMGALLAVVVLALFLKSVRPTLVVAFSIPFSVLCALIFMYFSGLTLNVLTLGGIALAIGMLVDNSIVVLENIYRLRMRGIPPARAAVQGAKQITGAVVASTLTTVCVFLPAIFTTGLVSQLLVPFALTIAYVLAASLVVALTLVPTLCTYMFKNVHPTREGWFERLRDSYGRSLDFFLRHKALPILVALGLLAFSVAGVFSMGVNLMPSMTSKTIASTVTMPEGTEKDDAIERADQVVDAILSVDGVELVGAIDGNSTLSILSSAAGSAGSDATFNTFTVYVQLDDTVTTEAQVENVVEKIEKATRKIDAEVVTSASSSSSMSSMMGSGLEITLKGPDQETLLSMSEDVMAIVGEVDGYENVSNGMEDAADELQLNVDRAKLAAKGVTVAQLYQALAAEISTSADSASISVDNSSVKVTVVDETDQVTKENLLERELTVGDTTFKLGDVATLETTKASTTIAHENSERTMTVTADVKDGENNALLSRELQEKLDDYKVPDGCTLTLSGELDNITTMLQQMGLMALLGFVLIYLVMVAQFQSLLSPFIVILTVPLAFTGGFLALLIAGEQLDIMGLMGFLVLMGTVVNNGIVFVDYVNQLRRGGLEKRAALVATGVTRMRPILMTALTTILSMLPLVLTQDVGGAMQRGMALVVVGGMVYATFMTLYIVPIMYDLLYHRVPAEVDLGDDDIDEDPGDAAAYLEELAAKRAREASRQEAGVQVSAATPEVGGASGPAAALPPTA